MSGTPLPLRTEMLAEWLPRLTAGELLTLSGAVYAAGREAFDRLAQLSETGQTLPINLSTAILCCGTPTDTQNGGAFWDLKNEFWVDDALERLARNGLRVVVGRGERSERVRKTLIQNRGVYFAAMGSAAVLNGAAVKTAQTVAFEDLGEGALKRIGILELPLVVAIDSAGGDIYQKGPKRYLHSVSTQFW